VERYPTITFKSTRVDRVEGDRFRLAGDVTIKDENHPVIFAIDYMGSAKDPYGNVRAGFDARADLSRKEWGFTSNVVLETGGFLVSDKIELAIDVSAVKLTTTSP
jgi:polyisoprenoid-binding protein YceI